ncbi:MAG: helix-hairpin-helix domain-containing protein [Cytophagaceae bacterium]|nr:helix-hairpin-helix domain-containing protein [Cytophagaceae bacterium]
MSSIVFFIQHFFHFSKRELQGFFILMPLMAITIVIPPILDLCYYQPAEAAQLDASTKVLNGDSWQPPFRFNANTVRESELIALGFTPSVAQRWIKFRQKGGRFTSIKQVGKIYHIDTIRLAELQSYISFEDPTRKEIKARPKKIYPTLISIHHCDSAALEALRGIGPVLAGRIVKYRKKLGGFVDTAQYKEVYGLHGEALKELKEKTFLDKTIAPEKLSFNHDSLSKLAQHPYLGWKLAKRIVQFRKQHGNALSEEAWKQAYLFDTEVWIKLHPYLTFQESADSSFE